MSDMLATALAFSGRVGLFDAAAIAVSTLLILDLMARLVLESAWGPDAVPRYMRVGTRPLLALFLVFGLVRLVLVGLGLY